VLEGREEAEEARAFTFTEEKMNTHAKDCAAAKELAAQRRKPPRRPVGENLGVAWRGGQPQ
jgi:hypothetical protein